MIRLLQLLFFGHIHKWKIIKESTFERTYKGVAQDRGMRYYLQCENCGDVCKRDLI